MKVGDLYKCEKRSLYSEIGGYGIVLGFWNAPTNGFWNDPTNGLYKGTQVLIYWFSTKRYYWHSTENENLKKVS